MARTGRWKLIEIPHPDRLEYELYDLDRDIGESTNVAAENPAVVQRLSQLADKARRELGEAYERLTRLTRRLEAAVLQTDSTREKAADSGSAS